MWNPIGQVCDECPAEPVAREIAIQNGMSEYLFHKDGRHKRSHVDTGLITNALYETEFWHGVVVAARGEGVGDGV